MVVKELLHNNKIMAFCDTLHNYKINLIWLTSNDVKIQLFIKRHL